MPSDMKALLFALLSLAPPAHAQYRLATASEWQSVHDLYFTGTAPDSSTVAAYFSAHSSFLCSTAVSLPCPLAATLTIPESACTGRGRSRASRVGDHNVRVTGTMSGSSLVLRTTDYGSTSSLSFTGSAWQGTTTAAEIPLPGERTTLRMSTADNHFYIRSFVGMLSIETYADCRPR